MLHYWIAKILHNFPSTEYSVQKKINEDHSLWQKGNHMAEILSQRACFRKSIHGWIHIPHADRAPEEWKEEQACLAFVALILLTSER